MTVISDLVSDVLSALYDVSYGLAQNITYTPSGGTGITVPAIVKYGAGEEYRGADEYGINASIRVRASDVALPAKGDIVTIDADDWGVVGVDQSGLAGEWLIRINKE